MVLRDVLRKSPQYQKQYDNLKREFDGKSMMEYRRAKAKFFDKLRKALRVRSYEYLARTPSETLLCSVSDGRAGRRCRGSRAKVDYCRSFDIMESIKP